MISFREIGYWGRLGNQMFQFASSFGISRKLGLEIRFPLENCFSFQRTGPFVPEIGANMNVKCDLLDCFEIPQEFFIPLRHIRVDQIQRESNFNFDHALFGIRDNTAIQGYLQTEKYFSHCKDEIREIFQFKREIKEKSIVYLESLGLPKNTSKISVHVRRGDYLQSPDHHPSCGLDYFYSAFSEFDQFTDKVFLIFSDDKDWCEQNFKANKFLVSQLTDPYSELCAMSMCDHHIIANSSFSWWGAWLNPHDSKIVICPSKWFGPLLNKNVSDLYCENWQKI